MKRFHRILSALLCLTLFIPSLATVAFASLPTVSWAVPTAPAELDSLSNYLHASAAVEDNTSHLPVNVHTYYDSNKTYTPATIGEGGSVSILYVMNTNTERLGNKTDAELVASFLERGFFVLVLDYQNNPAATGTALDWSVQDIRCQVIGGNCFAGGKTYTAGTYTDDERCKTYLWLYRHTVLEPGQNSGDSGESASSINQVCQSVSLLWFYTLYNFINLSPWLVMNQGLWFFFTNLRDRQTVYRVCHIRLWRLCRKVGGNSTLWWGVYILSFLPPYER